jgi:hypothetical protein
MVDNKARKAKSYIINVEKTLSEIELKEQHRINKETNILS